jgi:hypothetical protein
MTVDVGTEHITLEIYRCFIVWQRNIWVILLPLLLLVSCIGDIFLYFIVPILMRLQLPVLVF